MAHPLISVGKPGCGLAVCLRTWTQSSKLSGLGLVGFQMPLPSLPFWPSGPPVTRSFSVCLFIVHPAAVPTQGKKTVTIKLSLESLNQCFMRPWKGEFQTQLARRTAVLRRCWVNFICCGSTRKQAPSRIFLFLECRGESEQFPHLGRLVDSRNVCAFCLLCVCALPDSPWLSN